MLALGYREAMRIRDPRPPRGERTTTSCGECRRRKQRCNHGRPCSNCARRFPQPSCEYRSTERHHIGHGDAVSPPITKSALPAKMYSEDEVCQRLAACNFAVVQKPRLLSPWSEPRSLTDGEVARWSGIDVATQFPGGASFENPWNSPWTAAPGTAKPLCNNACAPLPGVSCEAMSPPLQGMQTLPSRFFSAEGYPVETDEAISWVSAPVISASYSDFWPVENTDRETPPIPIAPTEQNIELLRTFVCRLSRFKASLDGNPDASNPYIKYYVPYCLQSPILAQVAIYTAACFLRETDHLDERVAMAHKGQSIRMLNDHLRSESSSSDEAITAVIQLIVDEWYWGETNDLRAHLRGLREMIRLRGGFHNLGLYGLISKLAIISDNSIALAFESPPFLQDMRESDPLEGTKTTVSAANNTPLVSSLARFVDCADAVGLHPVTASILDDMRFLISTVLALPEMPSPKELQKLRTTSAWIHDRISSLPDYSPLGHSASVAAPKVATVDGENESLEVDGDATHADVRCRNIRSHSPAARSPKKSRGIQSQADAKAGPGTEYPPDFLYQSVRLAALMYSRAITERRPFSTVVTQTEFLQLWTTMWLVPLATWKQVLGVFNWAVLPVAPAASGTSHGRSVKSMLTISTLQMGLDDWALAGSTMKAALGLQHWLAAGDAGARG